MFRGNSSRTGVYFEKWSFAIITDLHIGWGIPDYDGESYADNKKGQNYYLTKRLKKTINWINQNYKKPEYNIKFVVVLGDISDTAEYSELSTARNILNQLEIPYIPVIGNHDIWPYIQKINSDPDGGKLLGRWHTIKDKRKKNEKLGDKYFETIFWKENPKNMQKINSLFDYFERQEEKEEYKGASYFQNYAFSYKGINFIALDFNSRDEWKLLGYFVNTSEGHKETLKWFEEKLKEHPKEKIVFTHHPFMLVKGFNPGDITNILLLMKECNCKIFNFAGHTHINTITTNPPGHFILKPGDVDYEVIETEAILQSKIPIYSLTGGFIRLVKITDGKVRDINYGTLIGGFPSAINSYFTVNPGEVSANEKIIFRAYTKNLEPKEIFSYIWKFDENYSVICNREDDKCMINETGSHNIKKAECKIKDWENICTPLICIPVEKEIHSECTVVYNQPNTYRINLKVIPWNDKTYSEEIFWHLKVKEKAKSRWKIFLPIPGLVPLLHGEEDIVLTQQDNAQNTTERVMIAKMASSVKPVGAFEVHFEEATEDIDLSNLVADINFETKKSILYLPKWPEVIEKKKILFVPK